MSGKKTQPVKRKHFLITCVQKVRKKIEEQMNNYNVRKKLHITYIFCMLLPLIITDSIILAIIVREDQASARYELENIAEAVQYNLISEINDAVTTANNIYINRYINDFMTQKNESPLDYYNNYLKCMQYSLFKSSIGSDRSTITMYADNETIINGGEFARLETVRDTQWYRYAVDSGRDIMLYVYYDDSMIPVVDARRKISLIRKLNYYERDGCEKVVKIDMDYSNIVHDLVEMNYEVPVYICMGDQIILSNVGYSSIGKEFAVFSDREKVGHQEPIAIFGQELEIYVMKKEQEAWPKVRENMPMILLLICINALFPWLFVKIINQSFTERLQELSSVFDDVEGEKIMEISSIRGEDEIGMLMRNYNRMAARLNKLIQTVYKDRLKRQEIIFPL